MNEIHFIWDDAKSESNLIKHQVSFPEATSVFDDENARLFSTQGILRMKTGLSCSELAIN